MSTNGQETELVTLSNEYATVRLSLDKTGNGPRLRVFSARDHREILLDPMALALLCHADYPVWQLLADAARDADAWEDDAKRRRLYLGPKSADPTHTE